MAHNREEEKARIREVVRVIHELLLPEVQELFKLNSDAWSELHAAEFSGGKLTAAEKKKMVTYDNRAADIESAKVMLNEAKVKLRYALH